MAARAIGERHADATCCEFAEGPDNGDREAVLSLCS